VYRRVLRTLLWVVTSTPTQVTSVATSTAPYVSNPRLVAPRKPTAAIPATPSSHCMSARRALAGTRLASSARVTQRAPYAQKLITRTGMSQFILMLEEISNADAAASAYRQKVSTP
jgi:hypothetical protein